MNRRGFLSSLAAALVLDPERLLWVPGRKLISVPKPQVLEPRWKRPLLEVGDVVTFGRDQQRYVVMQSGDPKTALGATFAMISGRSLPFPMLPPLDDCLKPLRDPRAFELDRPLWPWCDGRESRFGPIPSSTGS